MDHYDMTVNIHVYGTLYAARKVRDAIQEAMENAAVDDRAPLSKALARLRGGFTLEVSPIAKRRKVS